MYRAGTWELSKLHIAIKNQSQFTSLINEYLLQSYYRFCWSATFEAKKSRLESGVLADVNQKANKVFTETLCRLLDWRPSKCLFLDEAFSFDGRTSTKLKTVIKNRNQDHFRSKLWQLLYLKTHERDLFLFIFLSLCLHQFSNNLMVATYACKLEGLPIFLQQHIWWYWCWNSLAHSHCYTTQCIHHHSSYQRCQYSEMASRCSRMALIMGHIYPLENKVMTNQS